MTFYQQDTYIFRCYKIYIYILRESKREFRYRNLPVIRKLACSAFFFVTRTIVNPNDVSAHTAPCCTGVCLWSIRPSIHPSVFNTLVSDFGSQGSAGAYPSCGVIEAGCNLDGSPA